MSKPHWQRRIYFRRNQGHRRHIGPAQAGFMHAHKDGSPVQLGQSSWRTVNGVYFNTPFGYGMIVFWRHP